MWTCTTAYIYIIHKQIYSERIHTGADIYIYIYTEKHTYVIHDFPHMQVRLPRRPLEPCLLILVHVFSITRDCCVLLNTRHRNVTGRLQKLMNATHQKRQRMQQVSVVQRFRLLNKWSTQLNANFDRHTEVCLYLSSCAMYTYINPYVTTPSNPDPFSPPVEYHVQIC